MDRGEVVRTMLLVGVPLVLCIIVWACIPRSYYTGTNSLRTRAFVQPVTHDQTLCVRDLHLPARTAGVQFEVMQTTRRRPAMKLVVRDAAGATVARSRVEARPGANLQSKVTFAIAPRAPKPASVAVEACVTPSGGVSFGGTLRVGGVAPTIDGREVGEARIAVWFRPREGERRSLASQLPTVFRRASLFRPGWVGPWTYYVLIGFVLPLACGLALFLLIRAQTLSWPRLGAGVFAVTLLIGLSWSLLTPPFQAPDEQDHFAYAQQLAENHKSASQVPGLLPPWSSSLVIGLQSTRALAIAEKPDGRPPWLERDERAWARLDTPRASRKDGGGLTTAATHGPVYYGVMTVPYEIAGGASIWTQLTAMRIASALLAALTVLFVLLAAREVAGDRRLFAVGAALIVALNPMFTFIGASVNSDVGVNAAAALLLLLLLRAARRGLTLPVALAIGVTLGVLPVIKGTSYALYVVAVLVLLALLVKCRDRRVLVGIAATVAAVVLVQIGWSNVAATFDRTTFTTPGGGAPITGDSLWSTAGLSIAYIWQIFLPPLWFMYDHYPSIPLPAYEIYVVRGWAAFGWYAVVFPQIVYLAIIAGMAGTFASGICFARRRWHWVKANWVIVLMLVITPIIVVAAVERAFATSGQRTIAAEMGRYLFPAIGALGILAAGALWAFGERWAQRLTTAMVVCALALTFASQLLTLRDFYT